MTIKKCLYDITVRPLCRLTPRLTCELGLYKKFIWLIGDGRSGTTWVSNLINHRQRYHELFEPFHPVEVDRAHFLVPHHYVRPEKDFPELESFARDVFSGKFHHPRVDVLNKRLFFNGLLVKDIFAHLFAYWLSKKIPDLNIIFLIRNPFSVAASKNKLQSWNWFADPLLLWNQEHLRNDYLEPFGDCIMKTDREGDFVAKQILTWAIITHVPLQQFRKDEWLPVFYESIFVDPQEQLAVIAKHIHQNTTNEKLHAHKFKASRTARFFSPAVSKEVHLNTWKNELTARQIDNGLEILSQFGMAELFDENSMPDMNVWHNLINSASTRNTSM